MMLAESMYLALGHEIMRTGTDRMDRTGTGTRALFGKSIEADLTNYQVPLLGVKKINLKAVIGELFWMIHGGHNTAELHAAGVHIWDAWADDDGELGPVYGAQWRNWNSEGLDQLGDVIQQLRVNPYSRRHIVSAWNVSDLDRMALPPCPVMFQFMVSSSHELTCVVTQRSADWFLGVPFDLAEYAILTRMVAKLTGLDPVRLVMNFGDVHIYDNHRDAYAELIGREHDLPPARMYFPLSVGNRVETIDDFTPDDLIFDYQCLGPIKAKIAI